MIKEQTILKDMEFVKKLLPDTYTIRESITLGSIHCVSETGIPDDSIWRYDIFNVIKLHFGMRFQEVYHNTCHNHQDFTIYLKPRT